MNKIITTFAIFLAFNSLSYAQRSVARPDKIGVGVGASFLYGDNTGIMSDFEFRVLPTASLDYTQYFDTHFDLRATLGWQRIGSGDFYSENLIRRIAEGGYPHAFLGNLIYADVMPVYILNPDRRGFLPSLIKLYGGIGLGVFHSFRDDEIRTYQGDDFTTETVAGNNTGVYFPVRIGGYIDLPELNGEIGLEAAMLISPFANMEGNSQQQKLIGPDIAVQLQVFYRIYLW
jgi:hypothetical protein